MAATPANRMPWWAWAWPALACALLAVAAFMVVRGVLAGAAALLIAATVFAAVYHAEVVAHRVGEPFGTLVLAVAVTVIEVALIVSIMLGGGPETAGLRARHGVRGRHDHLQRPGRRVPAVRAGSRHHEQGFQLEGASAALAVLTALVTLTLVLPNYTTSDAGAELHDRAARLRRRGVARALRLLRLRADGAPPRLFPAARRPADEETHAPAPSRAGRPGSAPACCCRALVAVVGLAKALTPTVEAGVDAAGAPKAVIGIVIAVLVLLPERPGGAARGAAEPAADEPEPRARLGAGEHRPDDPGGRGRSRSSSASRLPLGLGPKDRCCWR